MADPLSFLPPDRLTYRNHPQQAELYSAYVTFGTGDAKHFRSVSKKHVSVMTNWRCKECNLEFSKENGQFPRMAYCGHFIHEKCHLGKDAQEPYFKCRECGPGKDMTMAPLLDPVLEDFFEKLLKKGFRCKASNKECKKLHARYNIFDCPYVDFYNQTYYCVWCATTAEFERELAPLEKKIIPDGVTSSDHIGLNALASLDRTHSMHVNQCCLCRDTLCRPVKDCAKVDIAYLSCHHVCHVACVCQETLSTIKCNFCGKVSKKEGLPKRIWHGDQYLKYNQDEKFYVCEGRCKQSHPRSNFLPAKNGRFTIFKRIGVCVWCTVEKKEEDRREKKKDEHIKGMEESNKNLKMRERKPKK